MCGITGCYVFQNGFSEAERCLDEAVGRLRSRGPDHHNTWWHKSIGLGHTRLSILDTSDAGHQPMHSEDGEWSLIFNGEVYNFRSLRGELQAKGHSFRSGTDTEVVLKAWITWGADCLDRFNGFFAFAIYQKSTDTLFLARDRMGIKPVYFYRDDRYFIFGSEMKAITAFPVDKMLDKTSLWQYMQLNYIPGSDTALKKVKKLSPGHFLKLENKEVTTHRWYSLPQTSTAKAGERPLSYLNAQRKLRALIRESVQRRLVADVPLGAFLSGGVDSSVIVSQAAGETNRLKTFSIGYKDDAYFDETRYAEAVARKFRTDHTSFKLTRDDLYANFQATLDAVDEPFADSSALVVNILSRYTRRHVKVALSGDGGDELFGGYVKHRAEYMARRNSLINPMIRWGLPLWDLLPKGRHSKFTNRVRQLKRFAEGLGLSAPERYWRWCGMIPQEKALQYLSGEFISGSLEEMHEVFIRRKESFTDLIRGGSMNDVLRADLQMVLPDDMLTKVDRMSMAHGLEVRVPLLDHEVVEFVSSLPAAYKIDSSGQKKILRDAFREELPPEVYDRPKKGFEVPLLKWFRTDLKDRIMNEWLDNDFIREQGIFDPDQVSRLKQKLFSRNPEDVHARIYAIIVFQNWWQRNEIGRIDRG